MGAASPKSFARLACYAEVSVTLEARPFRFSPRPNRAHLVNWREWSPAAFEAAVREDKLIAICITAFWCGVCQHLDETALSSDEVQLLLNAYCVCIRVDERQRPDIDLRYSQEGWPSIAFLTPRAEPILTVNGMEAEPLIALLVRLVDLHDQHRAEFATPLPPPAAEPPREPDRGVLSPTTVASVLQLLRDAEDRVHGGWGGPNKYFYPGAMQLYLHRALRTGEHALLEHVQFTLETLTQRAIFDGEDGGFFRYSSKPDWNEPHREKLLGDQADLLRLYLGVFEVAGDPKYRRTAERLIEYLQTVLSPEDSPFFAGCQDFVRAAAAGQWEPVLDPVAYCDANARAASALLHAWRALGRDDCRARAARLLDELWEKLRAPDGGMYHYFDGTARVPGLLDDSVTMGLALLDGHACLGDDQLLERAALLGGDVVRMHLNPSGGFFDISLPGPAALQRPLTELTQNAAAAMFFLRLAEARGDARLRDAA